MDASPGYPAGPSPLMRPEEQGGPAGTIGMNNGLTFVLVFVFLHPRFRRVPDDAGRVSR